MKPFIIQVYPKPETLSCLLFVFIENEYDFSMLDRAAKDGRYAIAIFQSMIYRKPKSSQLVSLYRRPSLFAGLVFAVSIIHS